MWSSVVKTTKLYSYNIFFVFYNMYLVSACALPAFQESLDCVWVYSLLITDCHQIMFASDNQEMLFT